MFSISLKQEFVYRLNFVMWRVRNFISFFLVFFLWDSALSHPGTEVFGYNRMGILTYVFSLIIIKAVVLSVRSTDMAGEIARGDLSNHLLRPYSFFRYWFTRDIASKALNIVFSCIEAGILFLILKPQLFIQTDFTLVLLFCLFLASAVIMYFLLNSIVCMFPFWYPQQAWGLVFFLTILVDFLAGALFPLDVLPQSVQNVLYLTPFPYLLFIPLQIYLGKLAGVALVKVTLVSIFWLTTLAVVQKKLWERGLTSYAVDGR